MYRRLVISISLIFLLIFSSTCGKKKEEKAEAQPRQYFLEKVRNVLIAQAYADAFKDLSLKEKKIAWHLYRSAIAGGDITYDQYHRYSLKIRNILEGIVENPEGIEPQLFEEILEYTKMFWINNSNYDFLTSRKFLPDVTFLEFSKAASIAQENGADLGLEEDEELNEVLNLLNPYIFDADFEPVLTNKNPGEGKDMITGSAVNFYEGVTLAEVEAFDEQYPLNSKIAIIDGEIKELVYRAGNDTIPPGLYSEELERSAVELEAAAELCEPGQANVLRLLAKYFRTGEPNDFREYNIAWVQDTSFFDMINGFIEVYKDPRGLKGTYEAVVQMVDLESTEMMRKFANNALYFETQAPWKDEYKRTEINPPIANVVTIIVETGDAGPISPGGINLPNAQDVREEYGSKSIVLGNVRKARDEAQASELINEFALTEEEKELEHNYGSLASDLFVAMHEVLGHASGKKSAELENDPSEYIKEYYSTLEEARADLVALWNFFDDKLIEMGVAHSPDVSKAAYSRFIRAGLTQLRTVPVGDQFEEDHARDHHLIVEYIMHNTDAVEVVKEADKTYYRVVDYDTMHVAVGDLLAQIMEIKATGDYEAAKELIETHGMKFDTELRDEVLERARSVGMTDYRAIVFPQLDPVYDDNGEITDIAISYPMDLKTQMLYFKHYFDAEEPSEEITMK